LIFFSYHVLQRTFVYSNIPTFVFSLAALTYKIFCASRHINVTLNRSASECAQSVSGTCLFIYFIHDIVYPYTTRGWKILDYSTCCRKHHSIYDLVMFPGNTSRIIENFQSSRCIIYDNFRKVEMITATIFR
jgi:hypothetical protein